MIVITEKAKCTGCGACLNKCAKNSITMQSDIDGFWYPVVDASKCVNCHLCEFVCPFNKEEFIHRERIPENQYYAGQLWDINMLTYVSSGGAAWALARAVVEAGGIVYGVSQSCVDIVEHIRIDQVEDLYKVRRSKYLQSSTGVTFRSVKTDLENGKLVLYTGVGCQIAGLKSYLVKEYENLITADVICHGVPSMKAWKSYRNCLETQYKSRLVDIVFRDKSNGWRNNQYKIQFENGYSFKERSVDNPFHRGYLLGLYSRPSCGECIFNFIPRFADFTFADYWEYDGEAFSSSRELGVSLICINSERGKDSISLLKKYVRLEPTTEVNALKSARHLNNKPLVNEHRNQLLRELTDDNFNYIWKKYIKKPARSILNRIKEYIKRKF